MRVLFALVVLSTGPGCVLFGSPQWVKSLPREQGYVYGVGSAGVTYDAHPGRSEEIATRRALENLAEQIGVQIGVGVRKPRDGQAAGGRLGPVRFTDEDITDIELVEVWIDEHGRAGSPRKTYVLLRLPEDTARRIVARPS